MITLNTNLMSLTVQFNLQKSSNSLSTAIERMTSGYKINGAGDNAANYSITTNMTTKIGAYRVADDNVSMGLNLLSTASENLELISGKLTRLRSLAEQSANGTYGKDSKSAIKAEANALVDEIERLYNTTEYNGIKLYQGKKPENAKDTHTALIPEDAQRVSNVTSFTGGKTYTLSSEEDLIALQNLVNSGTVDTTNVTFVMTNDIDMSSVTDFVGIGDGVLSDAVFLGVFDGNGYAVKNLTINNENIAGLFLMSGGEIKNLSLENCDITGYIAGGIVAWGMGTISNCCVTGSVTSTGETAGLMVGAFLNGTITDCYASGNVSADMAGGLVGYMTDYDNGFTITISNCYTTGNVTGSQSAGGLVGETLINVTIDNCYTASTLAAEGASGDIVGYIDSNGGRYSCSINNSSAINRADLTNKDFMQAKGFTEANGWYTKDGYLPQFAPFTEDSNISFQVGIYSSENSRISLSTSFDLPSVSNLREIGNGNSDYLSQIDDILSTVSAKQTEYGAAQNRLESALEEISTQYENLVSSLSTLRDADISEVSSEYIRQQILQQASATLLATANQTPSIALQLL